MQAFQSGSNPRIAWLVGYALIGLLAILLGTALPTEDRYFAAMAILGGIGFACLPFHGELSFRVALATFGSALIIPYVPGQPTFWEAAALTGWSGMVILLFTRRLDPAFGATLRRNRWIVVGTIAYCIVLFVTLKARGTSLRIGGSSIGGGRFYFQQFACAIFPFLFAAIRTNEKTVTRLVVLQAVLASTYLLSDWALYNSMGGFNPLLSFLALSSDAVNFEMAAGRFGVRRFQSFVPLAQGLVTLLLVHFSLKEFTRHRGVWLFPALLGALALGLFSGHRVFYSTVIPLFIVAAYAQRFFTVRNQIMFTLVLIPLVSLTYAFADRLPEAGQRALSFLPGIEVSTVAQMDAEGTFAFRRELFRVGLDVIPDYLWMGRGFSKVLDVYSASRGYDIISASVDQGDFYNGVLSLLITTGLFGFLSMSTFFLGGTFAAWRIIRHLRTHGCDDTFSRVACVAASLWLANLLNFLTFNGSGERALTLYAIQAGMLILCDRLLQARLQAAPATEPEPVPESVPEPVPAPAVP